MSHTKEQWVAVDGIIYPANGREDGQDWITDCRSAGNHKENARRIVACVNACAGSSNDDMAHYASIGGVENIMSALEARAVAAEQQRDELLAALKQASESLGRFVSDEGWAQSDMDCMDHADAIIAKVEAANA